MKKFLTALALVSTFTFAGCSSPTGTDIGVDNKDDSTATYVAGSMTTRYLAKSPEYIENVFNASKKALDQLGYFRTGETPGKDRVTIYARAHGDISITVDIYKKIVETKEGAKQEWVYVAIRYGTWGNAKESQGIISKISANLN